MTAANAPGWGRRARPEAGSIVLLVGGQAEALAPRLELSGHRPMALEPEESGACPQPQAVIVAPDQEGKSPGCANASPGCLCCWASPATAWREGSAAWPAAPTITGSPP